MHLPLRQLSLRQSRVASEPPLEGEGLPRLPMIASGVLFRKWWCSLRLGPGDGLKLSYGNAASALSILADRVMITGVPLLTLWASSSASQFVNRMQPCEAVLLILSGSGVP